MAQIDMKNALLKIKDGGRNTTLTGAINNVAGYTAGNTTLVVDGFVGAVETGGTIVIGANEYTIASHTETTGNTTQIVIAAPGIVGTVADNAPITAYGKVNEITVKVGEGTLTYSEKRTMEYTLNRGTLDEVREGDEVPMDVAFDLVWEYITGTTGAPTVEDALKKIGEASTWRSSDTDACKPYAVDIVVEYEPDCTGDPETITLPDFRWEALDHDLKAGTIKCTGKCNATVAEIVRG
jgi:hypothetical protein